MKKISWLVLMLVALAAMSLGCGKGESVEGEAPATPDLPIETPTTPELPSDSPEQDPNNPAIDPSTPVSPTDTPASKPEADKKPAESNPTPTPPTKPTTPPAAKPDAPSSPVTPPPTKPTTPPAASLSAKELAKKVLANFETSSMMEFDADTIATLYGIDTSAVTSYSVQGPVMNVKVNEIAIFELADAKEAATFKKACEKRAADVAKTFEHYLEDQYAIAKAPTIISSGNYVFMAISEDAVTMGEQFKKLVK